jgi:hypothetical protein
MRLVLLYAPGLAERLRVRAVFAAERVLADRGVTLPDCLAAIAADARKEQPNAAHWLAFQDAEQAALAFAYGSADRAAGAVLGLSLGPGDELPVGVACTPPS